MKEFNKSFLQNKVGKYHDYELGSYFKPMKRELLQKVINKIKTNNYLYQIDT